MSDRERRLREAIERRVLSEQGKLPTTSFGRFGRAALLSLRGRRLAREEHAAAPGGEAPPPDLEALGDLVSSIGQLKGIAMKVGQIMSYIDVALPDDVRAALSALQTHSQPMPYDEVEAIVQADLGERAAALLAQMDPAPVAAASIGQVHRARLPGGLRVAVKVRYPDVDKAIAADFRPAALGTRMASLFYPGAKVDAMVREARARFLEECDYLHEARIQERFARIYKGHSTIAVPAVHPPYCSRRVLTSTWAEGLGFEAYVSAGPSGADRDRVGQALFEFYIGTLFLHGLYNCDPHPGNYVFQTDGRMVMLDYGCTREFERGFVAKLAALTRAVHVDGRDDLHRAFVELGLVREGRAYDFETARALVRSFYGPMLRDDVIAVAPGDVMTFGSIVKSKRELMKLALPGEFLFLFRIRFGLMSILSRLGARANWYRLERRYAEAAPR